MKSIRNLVFLLLTLLTPMAHAAPGDLDPLDPTLVGNYVLATAVQPDGKLILAGKFTSVLGVARNNIARLNSDGTLDATFNPNPNGDVNSVTVQSDGKILIGGSFTSVVSTTRNRIARLNADGTLDMVFNPNIANGAVLSLVVQADGKVLVSGSFTSLQPNGAASATTRNRIARLNTDGSLDTGFDPNASDSVISMAVQADGKVLVSGYFLTLQPNGAASATPRNRIARVNSDGTLDTGFNPNANNWVNSLALESDGQILLGGDFTTLQPNGAASATTRNRIARLNADGTLDTGFDPNAGGSVLGIAVQADGKVLLGGYFTTLQPNGAASATARNCVARVNADGTLDAAFDPKPNNALFGLALQADGKVLMGGLFSTLQPNGAASATTRSLFARVANDAAVSTVSVPSSSQVLWTRRGSAPEVSRVTFELSTDSGASWSNLGNGTRVGITSNWQLTGLSLSASGVVRARGATTNGYFNGSSGLVESSVSFPAPPSDPVAWLKAEGNATDATSYGNNGVVNGSVPYVTGKVGNSFNFTGNVANYIRIPNSASLQSTLLTVEYWVNFNSATNAVTVAKRNGSSDAWQAGIVYAGGNFLLQFVGEGADWYSAPLASPVGVWTHVAATYDGSTVKGYINGTQVLTQAVTLQLSSRTADVYVGNYAGTALPLDAKVDELSIYNRALSAAEVQAIYQAGPAGKTSAVPAPTVTGITPANGSTLGGTNVTITGTNFAGATGVTIGGAAATNVSVASATSITATTPAGSAGTASVVVTTLGGSNAANTLFTYVNVTPAPTVTGVSPSSGSTSGGTNVTITGTNFTGATAVTFGGNAATGVTVANSTSITATTPARSAGTASVVVTTPGGSNAANTFYTYVAAPPSVSLSTANLLSTSTTLTITGSGFDAVTPGNNLVSFSPYGTGTVTASTPTSLTVTGLSGLMLGALNAVVITNSLSSGALVQVATVVVPTPGNLDSLNPTLVGNSVLATAVQPDGKLILAGRFSSVLGVPRNNIARLNADGSLDTNFDPNANGDVASVTVQPDGKLLIGGDFTSVVSTPRSRVARLFADGTLDPGFNPNPSDGSVRSLVLQSDGKILLGGSFTALQPNGAASPTARNRIARVNADGTLDTGFNPNAGGNISSLALQADGKVLLGGAFTSLQPNGAASPTTRNRIARVNADGTLDTGFNPDANDTVQCVALQADGKVLIGGNFTNVAATTRNRIARLNADGTLDTGFDPNASAPVFAIAVQADGKVLLGGAFTTLQPNGALSFTARNFAARVNADGTPDSSFDPKPNNTVFGLGLQADGKVLLCGEFTSLQPNGSGSPTARNLFARLINDPATSTLAKSGSSPSIQLLWTLGGSAPDVSRVTFERSTNNGGSWSALGNGTRVGTSSNWQLSGLTLSSTDWVRARGAATHGNFSGSSGLVEALLYPSANRTFNLVYGDWFDPFNWSPFGVPNRNTANDANINHGAEVNIQSPGASAYNLNFVNGIDVPGQYARLNIPDGGTLTTARTELPKNGSRASALVNGGTWTNEGQFVISYTPSSAGELVIQGNGSVTTGTAIVAFGAGSTGSILLDGNANFAVTGGGIDLGSTGSTGVGTFTMNGGTASTSGSITIMRGTVNLNGGVLTSAISENSDAAADGTVTINGGTLRARGTTTLFSGFEAGDVTIGSNGGTIDTQGFTCSTALALTCNGPLFKKGSGKLTLTGNSTFSGGSRVRGGTLEFGSSSISGGAGEIIIGDEPGDIATMEMTGTAQHSCGGVSVGSGNGTQGTLNLKAGILTATQVSEGDGNGAVNFTGGTLRLSASLNNLFFGFEPGDVTLGTGGGIIDTQSHTVGSLAPMSGAGGLTKRGAGTLVMAPSNSYTGTTTIEGGTLVLQGLAGYNSLSSFSSQIVFVQSGATLAANGTVPYIVVYAGGKFTSGLNDIGTITAGTVFLQGTFVCKLDGASADRFNAGSLGGSGSPTIAFSITGAAPSAASYTIATYSSGGLGSIQFTGIPAGYAVDTSTSGQIKLVAVQGFSSWADGWPGLTDKTRNGDPDGDGVSNLMEFVLGGDPRSSSSGILPQPTLIGGNLTISYKRNDASEGVTTQIGEWSIDLINWNPVTPVLVNENGSASDDMTVSVPQSNAINGKLHLRLKVTDP